MQEQRKRKKSSTVKEREREKIKKNITYKLHVYFYHRPYIPGCSVEYDSNVIGRQRALTAHSWTAFRFPRPYFNGIIWCCC